MDIDIDNIWHSCIACINYVHVKQYTLYDNNADMFIEYEY